MDRDSFKKFLSEVRAEYDRRMLKESYQINVIDEIVGNSKNMKETAHCRFLARLLQYRDDNGKYTLLENLLKKIQEQKPAWGNIVINEPKFKLEVFCPSNDSNEKDGRIDILIESAPYAIIVENKANDAGYQEHQIGRYIRKMIDSGFLSKNLFILCLPGKERSEPSEREWIYNDYNYRNDFCDRFSVLSYKNDILPWMKGFLDNINRGGKDMHYSINLYVNYLNSVFENGEDVEKRIIREVLSACSTTNKECINFFNSILSIEEILRKKRHENITIEEESNLSEKNDEVKVFLELLYNHTCRFATQVPGKRTLHFGLDISINNKKYTVYVGNNASGMFCSILSEDDTINTSVQNPLREIGLNCYNNKKSYFYDGYDHDYRILPKLELFFKVMDKCVELQKNEKTK